MELKSKLRYFSVFQIFNFCLKKELKDDFSKILIPVLISSFNFSHRIIYSIYLYKYILYIINNT